MSLIVVLLMLMLVAALVSGFTAVVMSEQRLQRVDEDRVQSFYAAHAGIEKLTADLGTLFGSTYAPTAAQVNVLATAPPVLPGVGFPATTDGPGYGISFTAGAGGNPASSTRTITSGPYQGFTGLVTTYNLGVTATTGNTGETRLERVVNTVGIPIFQFGVFSDADVSFEPGPSFTFTGRVHTNSNLYLGAAESSLTLTQKVTAVGEVIRQYLPDGSSNSYNDDSWVRIATSPGVYRSLRQTEGSVVGDVGSRLNEPTWSNLSIGTYRGNIVNGRTGARRLDLPIASVVASTPIELIRRPASGETAGSAIFGERYFSKATLRILLSDTAADITNLASVSGTAPVALGATLPSGYPGDSSRPPFALAASSSDTKVPVGTPLLGGYLKIEKQTSQGVWQDVTLEILNLGVAGPNPGRSGCTMPSPNAVIRLQHVADSTSTCNNGTTNAGLFYPNMLFDARQGKLRDVEPTSTSTVQLGGVIHLIELDVTNLSRWFNGTIGTSGTSIYHPDGYTVYFSDRRGNRNAANQETGEYGFEDFVNGSSSTNSPNGVLDDGEDINGNGVLDTYGATWNGGALNWSSPFGSSADPWTAVTVNQAKRNPARFFRRALKLTNGDAGRIISPGLTVVAENPVYVAGDYNAGPSSFNVSHVACSIVADAVTMLSNAWTDYNSFANPYESLNRDATSTWFRAAIISGKGLHFPVPRSGSLLGGDGGVNNFFRFLENWRNITVHYRGSMVNLYYHRQAVHPFRPAYSSGNNNNTYFPPDRDFQFDDDFLTFNLLPPSTPMFRDLNVLGFTQTLTAPR